MNSRLTSHYSSPPGPLLDLLCTKISKFWLSDVIDCAQLLCFNKICLKMLLLLLLPLLLLLLLSLLPLLLLLSLLPVQPQPTQRFLIERRKNWRLPPFLKGPDPFRCSLNYCCRNILLLLFQPAQLLKQSTYCKRYTQLQGVDYTRDQ